MRLRSATVCVIQEALRLRPEAVAEGCLQAQLYMMAGLPEDALETARALRLNAPADADSHALFILMKEAEGPTAESVPELAQAYVDMLQCEPASQYAVQGMGLPIPSPSRACSQARHIAFKQYCTPYGKTSYLFCARVRS